MKIIIYGEENKREDLVKKLNISLEELGLTDFIELHQTNENNIKKEMGIKAEPALIIEEESIDFKDIIFEGQTPDLEEIKSMLVSIIGGGESSGGCAPGGCGSGCSC